MLRLTGGNLELVCTCAAEEHSPYPPPLCVQRWGERERKIQTWSQFREHKRKLKAHSTWIADSLSFQSDIYLK